MALANRSSFAPDVRDLEKEREAGRGTFRARRWPANCPPAIRSRRGLVGPAPSRHRNKSMSLLLDANPASAVLLLVGPTDVHAHSSVLLDCPLLASPLWPTAVDGSQASVRVCGSRSRPPVSPDAFRRTRVQRRLAPARPRRSSLSLLHHFHSFL